MVPHGDILRNLIRRVKADPRKSAVLAMLAVVMLGLWIKVGYTRSPQAAQGAPATTVQPVEPAKPDNGVGRSRAETASAALGEWTRAPMSAIGRNLFAVKFDYFPQDPSKINLLRTPGGDGFWDEIAKWMASRADQKKERQMLLENLQLQAAQLKLQSIMMGNRPKAMINGKLVGEGDVVASFRVLKIEARRIIVEREGISFEVLMK